MSCGSNMRAALWRRPGGKSRMHLQPLTACRAVRDLLLISFLAVPFVATAQESLSEEQIVEAIALGKAGNVPLVKVSKFSGDFDVYIAGPVARIAAAANEATRRYRAFDWTNVTPDMSARVYSVTVHRAMNSESTMAEHIVLQPKGAKGMDGAIQPLPRDRLRGLFEFRFDRLPESDFQVVVVKGDRPQVYQVSPKDRAKIR